VIGVLDGKRILVAEDEPLIALDLADLIADHGASVVGPAYSLSDAQSLIGGPLSEPIDGALLDIDLGDDLVWPLALLLQQKGIPFAFISARCRREDRPSALDPCICIDKPATRDQILQIAAGF
jgi:DNA-binding response OmpR family regulator